MQDWLIADGLTAKVLPGWPIHLSSRAQLLLDHWAECRDGAVLPRRSRINPARICNLLPNIILIKREGSGFRYALAGEEINRAWGFSLIGRSPGDLWGASLGKSVTDFMNRLLDTPAIGWQPPSLNANAPSATARAPSRLLLPLLGSDGGRYGILCLTEFEPPQQDGDGIDPALASAVTYFHPCEELQQSLPLAV